LKEIQEYKACFLFQKFKNKLTSGSGKNFYAKGLAPFCQALYLDKLQTWNSK
jgi:hypothetical protein